MKPLIVDNTQLSSFTCPRRHYYRHKLNLTRSGTKPALGMGAAVHAGIAAWLKGQEEDAAIQVALTQFPAIEADETNWRTPERCKQILIEYFESRLHTRPVVVSLGNPPEPLVEVDFLLDFPVEILGQRTSEFSSKLAACGYSKLQYCGIIDDVQEQNGNIYPEDHKTTSDSMDLRSPKDGVPYLSANFGNKYWLDGGFIGYVWACQQLINPSINGIIVDGIGLLKPLKDKPEGKKRNVFGRTTLEVPQWKIQEWQQDVVAKVEFMCDTIIRGHTYKCTECCHSYGSTCQFWDMCNSPNELRENLKALYVEQEWNPLTTRETEATASTQ